MINYQLPAINDNKITTLKNPIKFKKPLKN